MTRPSLRDYLQPGACPPAPPARALMAADTRRLHDAIDARIRAAGHPGLHPDGPSVQTDLFGGAVMAAWQRDKAERVMLGAAPWSSMPPIYGRYGTASGRRLIDAVAALERAAGVVVTDSGMQAVATALDALLAPGHHALVSAQVYNKTRAYLEWLGERAGVDVELIDDLSPAALDARVKPTTRVVLAETYTNPLMRAVDPARLGAAVVAMRARAPELLAVIDHTIATPWGVARPLLSHPGIDVVVASGTKALGGHDQDMWGYIASDRVDVVNAAMNVQAMRGGAPAWRVADAVVDRLDDARALFERRCRSATAIAAFLAAHPRVSDVWHPSLPSHPDRAVIDAHYWLPGALVSFRVAGADEAATGHFCDVLAMTGAVRYALSFDGLTTKINHHATVSEFHTPPAALRRYGIDRLARLGVGVEHPDDVIACISWALWRHDAVSPDEVRAWQRERRAALGLPDASLGEPGGEVMVEPDAGTDGAGRLDRRR